MRNKKTKQQMKRFMNASFDSKLYINEHYIKKEKAVIPIHLHSFDDIYSHYDDEKRILNSELISYIENIVYYIPYQYSIVLEFSGMHFSEEEKIHLAETITEQFGLIAHDMQVELRYNSIKTMTLLALGAIGLLISFLIGEHGEIQFLREIFSIIGTFFIWEAIDNLWFERKKIKIALLNRGQLSTCTLDFLNDASK